MTPPAAPILEPIGDLENNLPIFQWESVSDCSYYILQYSNESDFSSPITINEIEPSEYDTNESLIDGDWYWRVKAVDQAGNQSEWSQIDYFTVDTENACDSISLEPILIYPPDGMTDVELRPEMQIQHSEGFDDCDDNIKIRWRISKNPEFKGLVDKVNAGSKDMTIYQPAEFILDSNTTYYWMVRYIGKNNSDWSEAFSFTTGNFGDDDNENQDGDNDENENNGEKSCTTVKGDVTVTIKSSDSRITHLKPLSEKDVPGKGKKPDDFPYGLISYRLEVENYGDTAVVNVQLSEPAPKNTRWVFHDSIEGWQDFSTHVSFNADRSVVTVELKDGSFGDNDHTENKVIVDPSGLGIYIEDTDSDSGTVVYASPGGSGGCFINSIMK